MERSQHIINRQSLEVDFRCPGQGKGMQDRVAAVYYQQILPQLGNLFDDFSNGRDALRISVLSVDCGEIPEADWEEMLAKKVLSLVRKELQSYGRPTTGREEQHNRPEWDPQWAEDFIHFLTKGKFQWESRKETIPDFEKRFKPESAFLDELTQVLHVSADAMNRLFHYFSADFIHRLCEAFVARISSDDLAYIVFLKQTGVNRGILSRSIIRAYGAAFSNPATEPMTFSIILTSVMWPAMDTASKMKIAQRVNSLLERKPKFMASLLPLVREEFPALADTFQLDERIKPHPEEPVRADNRNLDHQAVQRPTETIGGDSSGIERLSFDTADAESFYLSNAGLVLVHPFIEPLMQHVGLIGDEIPFSLENRAQAAILLQYLVYASPALEESMLVLNKVLSGVYPESFVNPDGFEWSPSVKQECEDVLHSVIAHWEVLRNTSVDGLRETFLQREGKLTRRADSWLLQVDSRGVDVLMASLPWSIGIIKLPWMDRMLYVEWI